MVRDVLAKPFMVFIRRVATETQGVFRVSGSSKRMRDLQALFEAPPKVITTKAPAVVASLTRLKHSMARIWTGRKSTTMFMT